jgi:acetyl-CoA carboxylase biotin carboxyl carrier protein
MKVDRDAIRDLAEILKDTDLTEIEIEEKDLKIRVAREVHQVVVSAPVATAPLPAAPAGIADATPAAPAAADATHPGAVTSPMVGTVYMAPEPGEANFVSVGDKVNAGDTLMIVEAMKVMNPIKAETGGTVTQIVASDSSPVEFGDVLAVIE